MSDQQQPVELAPARSGSFGKTFAEEKERLRKAGPPSEFPRDPDGKLGKQNIVGIAKGHRKKEGGDARGEHVLYFVRVKPLDPAQDKDEIAQEWMIPRTLGGLPTAVIPIGTEGLQSFKLQCGMTVGAGRGTGGCLLKGRLEDEESFGDFLLTSGHVLVPEGRVPEGGEVHWEPLGLPTATSTRIGYLLHFTDLVPVDSSEIDIGLVSTDGTIPISALLQGNRRLPRKRDTVKSGAKVWKFGAATGYTEGKVLGLEACGWVRYPGHPRGFVFLDNQILLTDLHDFRTPEVTTQTPKRFAGPGDSGAMINTFGKKRAVVGLLVAGSVSDHLYFANPIGRVFEDLDRVGSNWAIQ